MHLLEVGTFFREKLVKFRVIYFVDSDRSGKNFEKAEKGLDAIFQSDVSQSSQGS
jgi:hypothetical protein